MPRQPGSTSRVLDTTCHFRMCILDAEVEKNQRDQHITRQLEMLHVLFLVAMFSGMQAVKRQVFETKRI